MNNSPLAEVLRQRMNASVALVDLRKVQRDLKLRSSRQLLDRVQEQIAEDVLCGSCRGDGYYDDDSTCLGCNGKGRDRAVPVPRLYDRYRDQGRQIVCSVCLETTHSETECEHCRQVFVRAPSLEQELTLSLTGSERAA
jgi:hypothetical protein